jgi:hypothetical protein
LGSRKSRIVRVVRGTLFIDRQAPSTGVPIVRAALASRIDPTVVARWRTRRRGSPVSSPVAVNADIATDTGLGSSDENVATLILVQGDVRTKVLSHAVVTGRVFRPGDRRLVLSRWEEGVVVVSEVGERVGRRRETGEGRVGRHGEEGVAWWKQGS